MKRIMIVAAMTLLWLAGRADSPLTSTDIASAYDDCEMVQYAIQLQNGENNELRTSILYWLSDAEAPVDERIAVVNKLGWNFDGKISGDQLEEYLMRRYKVDKAADLASKLDAETLIVLAYTKAMSNYFNVTDAAELGHKAVEKNKNKSFTVAFISALIDAQIWLDSDWNMVYNVVANVLADSTLHRDMRQAAVDSVMEYINLYEKY